MLQILNLTFNMHAVKLVDYVVTEHPHPPQEGSSEILREEGYFPLTPKSD